MEWEDISGYFKNHEVKALRGKLLKERGYDSIDEYLSFPKKTHVIEELFAFKDEVFSLYEKFDLHLLETQISRSDAPLHFIFIPFSNFALKSLAHTSVLIKRDIDYKIVDSIIEKLYNSYSSILYEELKIYLDDLGIVEQTIESERLFVLEACRSREWYDYLFDKYPVFLDHTNKILSHYVKHINVFFSRLTDDIDEITADLLDGLHLQIVDIKSNLGDPHNDCQSTIGIVFEDNYEVYYKVRSSSGERYFYSFMNKLWQSGLQKSFVEVVSINKETYSWHKGVHAKELENLEQGGSFYFKQGINCYLAYVFNIQDLIADNIIVVGDMPCFFDLEILFHPKYKEGNSYKDSSQAATEFINGILKTGLLPQFGFETITDSGYSNDGLSILADHENYSNIPRYKSEPIGIEKYIADFLSGFEHARSFVSRNKEEIQDELRKSDSVMCRVLIRFTNIYTRLLSKLSKPTFMRSFVAEAYLLEMLWRGYHPVHMPGEVIQSEIDQILNGDIPFFQVSSDSTDLLGPTGRVVFKDFFKKCGKSFVFDRILKLDNEQNYQTQLNMIRRAFTIHENADLPLDTGGNRVVETGNLLEMIAEYMLDLDTSDQKYFSYIDYTITKDSMWTQGIQESDLFNGIPGVGLFFMAYYKESRDQRYLFNAKKIFDQSVEYFLDSWHELQENPTTDIGIFHFPVSILYMSALFEKIDNTLSFALSLEVEEKLLKYIKLKLRKDKKGDYLFGATGVGLLLIELEKKFSPDSKVRCLIEETADYLIETSSKGKNCGITWETASFNKWGGFAHGTASTSYFFFKVHKLTGKDVYFETAIGALAYDQSLFNRELGFWQKTEDFVGDIHHGWASGVAGILLSRHLISEFYLNDFMLSEIQTAKAILQKVGYDYINFDHSLCSGFFGILEIYEKALGHDDEMIAWKDSYIATIKNLYMTKTGGWNKNQKLNGLFYGLAGIGYGLLKNYRNSSLPSVLYI